MTNYTTDRKPMRGEIYWIESSKYRPPVGNMIKGRRPAIIVSNNKDCMTNPYTYQVVYLTTAPKKSLPTHCTVNCDGTRSTALCEQISTISDEQLGPYKGTVRQEEMKYVDICLAISLGLSDDALVGTPDYESDVQNDYMEPSADDINEEIAELDTKIRDLETELAKTEAERNVYKDLYDDMIVTLMQRA